jgi:adenylate kinase family enzyme
MESADFAGVGKRIHITGSAGSGKTTLAKSLSTHLAAPCYDLDEVAYEGGYGKKIALDARMDSLRQIVAQPEWVTEGVFIWWTEALMDAADLIVWLDLPFYITGWRIVARHYRLSWAGTNRHPGTLKLLRFLSFVMRKQISNRAITPKAPDDDAATTRIATAEFLRKYESKLIHCTRPAEVAHFKTRFLSERTHK